MRSEIAIKVSHLREASNRAHTINNPVWYVTYEKKANDKHGTSVEERTLAGHVIKLICPHTEKIEQITKIG